MGFVSEPGCKCKAKRNKHHRTLGLQQSSEGWNGLGIVKWRQAEWMPVFHIHQESSRWKHSEIFWEGGLGTPLSGHAMLPHCLQFSPCSFPAVHLGAIRHFDDKLIDILTQLVLSSCRDPIKLEHEHDPPIHLGFCQSFGNHRVRSLEWSCENRYDLMGTREWCAAGHWDMAGYELSSKWHHGWPTSDEVLAHWQWWPFSQKLSAESAKLTTRTHWDHWVVFMPSFQNRTWRSILGNHTRCMSCFSQSDDQLASVSGWMMLHVGWT